MSKPKFLVRQRFVTLGDPTPTMHDSREEAEAHASVLRRVITDMVSRWDIPVRDDPKPTGITFEIEAWREALALAGAQYDAQGDRTDGPVMYGRAAAAHIANRAVEVLEEAASEPPKTATFHVIPALILVQATDDPASHVDAIDIAAEMTEAARLGIPSGSRAFAFLDEGRPDGTVTIDEATEEVPANSEALNIKWSAKRTPIPIPGAMYVVHSRKERGFWSNDDGWVYDITSATRFAPSEVIGPLDLTATTPDAEWLPVAYGGEEG